MPLTNKYFSLTGATEVAMAHRPEIQPPALRRAKNFYVSRSDQELTLRGNMVRFRDDIYSLSKNWVPGTGIDTSDLLNTVITTGDPESDIYITRTAPFVAGSPLPICSKYDTGTITTNGAIPIVNGTNTLWLKSAWPRCFIKFDGSDDLYRILTVESDTLLTVEGTPPQLSGAKYTIYLTHDTDRMQYPAHFDMFGETYIYNGNKAEDPTAEDQNAVSGPFYLQKQDIKAVTTAKPIGSSVPVLISLRGVAFGTNYAHACGAYGTIVRAAKDGTSQIVHDATTDTDLFCAAAVGSTILFGGSLGRVIRSTDDGANWSVIDTGISDTIRGVVMNDTAACAVGDGGSIVTSADSGATWTVRTSGSSEDLNAVIWDSSKFVAVGTTGTVLTSPTGVTWTARTSGVTDALNAIAWSGTVFVAVGANGVVITSADGVTWAIQTSGTVLTLNVALWDTVSRFVIAGNSGTVLDTVDDGVTWVTVPMGEINDFYAGAVDTATLTFVGNGCWHKRTNIPTITKLTGIVCPGYAVSGLAYNEGAGVWVASTSNGLYSSSDLLSWTNRYPVTATLLSSVVFDGFQFVAIEWSPIGLHAPAPNALTSLDGVAWTATSISVIGFPVRPDVWTKVRLASDGLGKTIAVGDVGLLLKSANGKTWTGVNSACGMNFNAAIWAGGSISLWVIVGVGGTVLTFDWTAVTVRKGGGKKSSGSVGFTSDLFNDIALGTGLSVTINDGTHGAQTFDITTSYPAACAFELSGKISASTLCDVTPTVVPGIDWRYYTVLLQNKYNGAYNATITKTETPGEGYQGGLSVSGMTGGTVSVTPDTTEDFTSIAWDGTTLLVFGEVGGFRYSTDGIAWSDHSGDGGVSKIAIWCGHMWVSSPAYSWGPVLYSDDSTTWGTTTGTAVIGAMAFDGYRGILVEAMSGQVYTFSPFGWTYNSTKTSPSVYPTGRIFSGPNGSFIAPANKGLIFTSSDRVTWAGWKLPTWFDLKGAASDATGAIVVGDKGEIFYSSGTSYPSIWTRKGSGTDSYLRSAANGLGIWVAVGGSGTIQYSSDAETWVNGGIAGHTENIRDVIFDGTNFIICGEVGLLASSPDAVTWTVASTGLSLGKELWALLPGFSPLIVVGDSGTVLISSDHGATWTAATSGTFANLFCISSSVSRIVAMGAGGVGIQSEDNGTTWKKIVTGDTQDAFACFVNTTELIYDNGAGGRYSYTLTPSSADLKFLPLSDKYRSAAFVTTAGYLILVGVSEFTPAGSSIGTFSQCTSNGTSTITPTPESRGALGACQSDGTSTISCARPWGFTPSVGDFISVTSVETGEDLETNGYISSYVQDVYITISGFSSTGTVDDPIGVDVTIEKQWSFVPSITQVVELVSSLTPADTGTYTLVGIVHDSNGRNKGLILNKALTGSDTGVRATFWKKTDWDSATWEYKPRRIIWTAPGSFNDFDGYASGVEDLPGSGYLIDARALRAVIVIFESDSIGVLNPTGDIELPFEYSKISQGIRAISNPVVIDDAVFFISSEGLLYQTNGVIVQQARSDVTKEGTFFTNLIGLDVSEYIDIDDGYPVSLVYNKDNRTLLVFKYAPETGDHHLFTVNPDSGSYAEVLLSDVGDNFPLGLVQVDTGYPISPQTPIYGHGPLFPGVTGPGDKDILSGTATTLTVTGTGEAPLTYAWYLGESPDDSSPIDGVTSATLTTETLTSETKYWARVSNAYGNVDSDTGTVSVHTLPFITVQPQDASIAYDDTDALTVTAIGSMPLSYQWYVGEYGDTTTPVGNDSTAYTTAALTTTTKYWVNVTNAYGAAASDTATVTVASGLAPTITVQPQDSECGVLLTVTVTGTAPFTYQWYEGTEPSTTTPVGTNSSSFDDTAIATDLGVSYHFWVRITNAFGQVDSRTVTVFSAAPH